MTYDDLVADFILMRSGNEDTLSVDDFNDSELAALMKPAAKLEMKLDLEDALSIDPDDSDSLDAVVTDHSARLTTALAYKQLQLFYQQIDEGEGSKAHSRMQVYETRYLQMKKTFPKLNAEIVSSTQFVRILR